MLLHKAVDIHYELNFNDASTDKPKENDTEMKAEEKSEEKPHEDIN